MPEAAGKRFILVSEALWFKKMASILSKFYPEWGINVKEMPKCPVKFLSFFDYSVRPILLVWGK